MVLPGAIQVWLLCTDPGAPTFHPWATSNPSKVLGLPPILTFLYLTRETNLLTLTAFSDLWFIFQL